MTKLIWTIILFLTSFNLTTLFVNYTKLEAIRGGCQRRIVMRQHSTTANAIMKRLRTIVGRMFASIRMSLLLNVPVAKNPIHALL
jgi:hypothetical protein